MDLAPRAAENSFSKNFMKTSVMSWELSCILTLFFNDHFYIYKLFFMDRAHSLIFCAY